MRFQLNINWWDIRSKLSIHCLIQFNVIVHVLVKGRIVLQLSSKSCALCPADLSVVKTSATAIGPCTGIHAS